MPNPTYSKTLNIAYNDTSKNLLSYIYFMNAIAEKFFLKKFGKTGELHKKPRRFSKPSGFFDLITSGVLI
jgi:hypothetical protein